ncbi:hypothetical protein Bpro_4184 [Polaromonas sp. JS666]|nr:hypothetical protein Bpro_4184 [Polaromonas sp. JS666]
MQGIRKPPKQNTAEPFSCGRKGLGVACQLFFGRCDHPQKIASQAVGFLLVPVECFGNFGLCRCFKNNPRSQTHAKRLRDLGQAFALSGVGVTPDRTAFKFVQNVISGFRGSLSGKLIPQVFHQLKALKLAKVFNGLQCGFHAAKSSTPASEWCCQQVHQNGGRIVGGNLVDGGR